MEQAEKLKILSVLESGRDALGQALEGLDDDFARRQPPSGGWSILGCVEHLIESERHLLSRLHVASQTDKPFEKSRREAKIAALAADRNRRIEAPAPVHPRGRYDTLAEAIAAFDATRTGVISWVENCTGDPRRMLTSHPLIEGPVTCSETLIMIAAHPARHAKQIEEIKSALSQFSAGDSGLVR